MALNFPSSPTLGQTHTEGGSTWVFGAYGWKLQAPIYETDSFTPTVVGSTTAGVGTYTAQSGTYTRSGNLVTFRLNVTITGHTGTGNIRISGLPFTAANIGNVPVTIGQVDNLTTPAGTVPHAEVVAATSQIRLLGVPTAGGVSAGVGMDTAFTIAISGTYIT